MIYTYSHEQRHKKDMMIQQKLQKSISRAKGGDEASKPIEVSSGS